MIEEHCLPPSRKAGEMTSLRFMLFMSNIAHLPLPSKRQRLGFHMKKIDIDARLK